MKIKFCIHVLPSIFVLTNSKEIEKDYILSMYIATIFKYIKVLRVIFHILNFFLLLFKT